MTKSNTTAFEFVTAINDEPRASSLVIANGMNQDHRITIRLIRKYIGELSQFGRVNFENAPFATKGGDQSREIAQLNERQSALLITFMRNSAKAVEFKVSLIREFYGMADELNSRNKNLWQQMQELIAKEVESKVKASFGSHLMLNRKREIPRFNDERHLLESAIQKPLFIN